MEQEQYSTPEQRAKRKQLRGLGDVVAAVTGAIGIKSCQPCKQRQAKLNALVPFKTVDEPK